MAIRNLLKTVGLLLLLLLLAAPLTAQQTLSDDELDALIERLIAAVENADTNVESYIGEYINVTRQEISIDLGEQAFAQVSITDLESTWVAILGDDPNGYGEATVIIEQDQGFGTVTLFEIIAEMRYVDGVLYVNASYADGETPPGTFELPIGWVVVEDLANFPEFTSLSLDTFLNSFREDSANDLLETIPEILGSARAVTIYEDELDDTPVEVFEFSFDGEGFLAFMSATVGEQGPEAMSMFEMMAGGRGDDAELMTITFYLDEEERLLRLHVVLDVEIVGGDATTLAAGMPPDATLDLNLFSDISQKRTNFNEDYEAIEAPELGG